MSDLDWVLLKVDLGEDLSIISILDMMLGGINRGMGIWDREGKRLV